MGTNHAIIDRVVGLMNPAMKWENFDSRPQGWGSAGQQRGMKKSLLLPFLEKQL